MWQTVAVYLSSLISLEFEHFRDRPASLEELLLRYLPVAVEVALTEAAIHLTIDLLIVQRLALQEVLALCDVLDVCWTEDPVILRVVYPKYDLHLLPLVAAAREMMEADDDFFKTYV